MILKPGSEVLEKMEKDFETVKAQMRQTEKEMVVSRLSFFSNYFVILKQSLFFSFFLVSLLVELADFLSRLVFFPFLVC